MSGRASVAVLAVLAFTAASAMSPSAFAQDTQVRLSPAEIDVMATSGAGPGTSGIAGIQTTILYGDPTKPGPYTIEIRVPPHTRIAAHTHRDGRSAVVISGTWYFGYGAVADESGVKALPPGSFYTEATDDPHFAMTRAEPVVVYLTGSGPTDTRFTPVP